MVAHNYGLKSCILQAEITKWISRGSCMGNVGKLEKKREMDRKQISNDSADLIRCISPKIRINLFPD